MFTNCPKSVSLFYSEIFFSTFFLGILLYLNYTRSYILFMIIFTIRIYINLSTQYKDSINLRNVLFFLFIQNIHTVFSKIQNLFFSRVAFALHQHISGRFSDYVRMSSIKLHSLSFWWPFKTVRTCLRYWKGFRLLAFAVLVTL